MRTPTVRVPPWRWWNFTTENGSAKGATLSGKTARSEYGLTRDEIFVAIDAGKLQYGPRAMLRKRWLRLLRREIEDLAMSLHGDPDLPEQQPVPNGHRSTVSCNRSPTPQRGHHVP